MTDRYNNFDEQFVGLERKILKDAFNNTDPAAIIEPIPEGKYIARWIDSGSGKSRNSVPFLMGRFEIISGKYYGRKLKHWWYLSPAALPYTKRALLDLGVTEFEQLEKGNLLGEKVRLRVKIRKNDDSGEEYNVIGAVLPWGKNGWN